MKRNFDLQYFATAPRNPEDNQTGAGDLGDIRSIDFVSRFAFSIDELLETLGVTRRLPMAQDQKIQTYKWETTKPSTNAGEGEIIPLTKVERKPHKDFTVTLNKTRKVATAEAINRFGREIAINQADNEVMGKLQMGVKADFFDFLSLAPTKQDAPTLQMALAKGWAKARKFFKDMGAVEYVSFINSMDLATYLGDKPISAVTSTQYGFTLLSDFLNQTVIVFDDVPEGKIYTTAVDNIVFAYCDLQSGDLGSTFDLTLDPSGLLGVSHSVNNQNASYETLVMNGATLFAEIADGVVETRIKNTPVTP